MWTSQFILKLYLTLFYLRHFKLLTSTKIFSAVIFKEVAVKNNLVADSRNHVEIKNR